VNETGGESVEKPQQEQRLSSVAVFRRTATAAAIESRAGCR
jgi:hypothetical protein